MPSNRFRSGKGRSSGKAGAAKAQLESATASIQAAAPAREQLPVSKRPREEAPSKSFDNARPGPSTSDKPEFKKQRFEPASVKAPVDKLTATQPAKGAAPGKKGDDDDAHASLFHKPAKPDEDLVGYMRQLEIPLTDVAKEVAAANAPAAPVDGDAAPASAAPQRLSIVLTSEHATLIRTAYRELRHKEASLASHKRVSVVMETLLRLSTPRQLLRLAAALAPYVCWLATSRYGSHVVQTLMALLSGHALGTVSVTVQRVSVTMQRDSESDEDEAGAEEEEENDEDAAAGLAASDAPLPARLVAALISVTNELASNAGDLIIDPCGSHLLRAAAKALACRSVPVSGTSGGGGGKEGAAGAGGKGGKGKKPRPAADGEDGGDGTAAAAVAARLLPLPAPEALLPTFATAVSALRKAAGSESAAQLKPALVTLMRSALRPGATVTGAEAVTGGVPAPVDVPALLASHRDYLYELCCDPASSPSVQSLLETAVASGCIGTARLLCRVLLGWGLQGLKAGDLDGSSDCPPLPPASYSSAAAADSKEARRAAKKAALAVAGNGVTADDVPSADDDSDVTPPLDTGAATGSWVPDLCNHAIGSHVVEAVLRHADGPLFGSLFLVHFARSLGELSLHPQANFVVQRLLVSCRARSQTEQAARELLPHMRSLATGRREGVVLALVTAVAGAQASSSSSPSPSSSSGGPPGAIVAGGHARQGTTDLQRAVVSALCAAAFDRPIILPAPAPAVPGAAGESAGASAPPALAARPAEFPAVVRWWLDINGTRQSRETGSSVPEGAGSGATRELPRLLLSLTGVRILAAALHGFTPEGGARVVAEGLGGLTSAEVAGLASDPTSSRHLIEPLFPAVVPGGDGEAPASGGGGAGASSAPASSAAGPAPLATARYKVFSALAGWWPALACSRFGCWTASKAFLSFQRDAARRKTIAKEIASESSYRAVSATPGGRQVLRTLRIDHYRTNPEGWEAFWSRSSAKSAMFNDILGGGSAAAPAAAAAGAGGKGEDKPRKEGKKEKKDKKRERAGSDAAAAGEDDAPAAAVSAPSEDKKAKKSKGAEAAAAVAAMPGGKKVDAAMALLGF